MTLTEWLSSRQGKQCLDLSYLSARNRSSRNIAMLRIRKQVELAWLAGKLQGTLEALDELSDLATEHQPAMTENSEEGR